MKAARPFTLAFFVLLANPSPTRAQNVQAPDTTTLKVDARLVAVSAVVRDNSGQPVSGLTRDDFLLKQDGRSQPITYFSQGSDLPLTLALMVDTSGSQRNYIQEEIAAGDSFFPSMMTRPEDRAVLVQFDNVVLQLAQITHSVRTLEHALNYLSEAHATYKDSAHGGTLLFEAICAVSQIELGNQIGRRAMVILTDGGDNGSRFNSKQALEEAQRADIMIYTVYYSSGGGDEAILKSLSKQTGGREFVVGPTMTLEQIYATIASDLRMQYEIGYRPPNSRPNKYHTIELMPKDKTLSVQAREGYFTRK